MVSNLEKIKINADLPLLICDADEVLFQFMKRFESFLQSNNLFFSYESFKLNGNIRKIKDNKAIEAKQIPILINNFFKEHTLNLELISGCKKNLTELKKFLNIVILTNMPNQYVQNRVKALENNGLFFDVISNNGEKGDVCAKLQKKTYKSVFFIDDSPNQILSVANKTKNIFKIHFLQHPKLISILPKIEKSDFNTNEWNEVSGFILDNI